MMSKRNMSLALVVLALFVGMWMMTNIGDAPINQPRVVVQEPSPIYDPWNYSVTIKKDIPVYSDEEVREILKPVLKDEL